VKEGREGAHGVDEGVVNDCEENEKSESHAERGKRKKRTKKVRLTAEAGDGTLHRLFQVLQLNALLRRVTILGRNCRNREVSPSCRARKGEMKGKRTLRGEPNVRHINALSSRLVDGLSSFGLVVVACREE
jgi:hypothetical protein